MLLKLLFDQGAWDASLCGVIGGRRFCGLSLTADATAKGAGSRKRKSCESYLQTGLFRF